MKDLTGVAIEQLKDDKGFVFSNNYKVLKVEDNYCEMEGIVGESSKNPFGIVHGGYIFGLADTAGGIAAMTDLRTAVTINSSIEYLKSGRSDKILAKANAIKNGKNICVVEVSIFDTSDDMIAKAMITYFYINKQ